MSPKKSLLEKKNLKPSKGHPLPASCSVSSLDEFLTDGNASFLRAARAGNLEKVIEYLKGNIDINTSNANGLNALHLAAKEGHVNVVTELLKRGANVNAATKKGNTALHIASLAGQEEVVRVLVQLGANVNVQSQNGFTPLYMAAQENHDSVVSFLLANGANQSLATEDGFTPLAVALQQGHDKVVAVLLENDTKGRVRLPALHIAAKKDDCKAATLLLQSDHNPDVTSKSGFTPLHIAAHYGNENIAKILLSKGADVNYAAKHQITPLHVASKWGKMNMVVLLLENGANIEAATRDGLTPLHCAARSGHDQVVDLLLEKGAPFLAKTKNGLAPLHMASQGDHVDSARILLYHKAPVDDVTVDYLTALHVAAHCGHVKVAKLLLDRKADPNARALNGFTPLHIACKKNRIKVVELLLKHGASIEATTESGLTPLHVASFMGCMNIVIYLIQNGANPDVPTVRGETPLHLAARANQTDIIRILLRNGASVDARAREEQTPLHIAARLGNVDIVSLLLQHGAAVDATTKDMYTALHIAAKEDQEEVASALLDHGASLTATTKKGFTPLHLAAKYGNIKVARLLLQKGAPVDAQGKNGVTPLHVAAHYDHVNVALLLLEKGASPHAMAKNGYTPLHIAAKKNQMDIASTLLEYGAKTNSESKAGFTPLHLSSQEGHADMSLLLIDHKADVNHKANNGLTPLHLCAQDDRVNVASVLVKHGAEIGPQTKAGYTPLHVASHFGQINMVRFLLQHDANVHTTTSHGYTPLHQAAQQGHTLVVNLLLENQASPNVTTMQGQTPLSIAQRLGYISVVETLKVVTETTVTTTMTTVTEEKYKVVAPETMQETFMTDSEDEGGEEAMLGDQSYRYISADELKSLGDDSLPIDVTKDEKQHDVMQSVKQFGAPMVEEDNLSPQHVTPVESGFVEKFSPDNIDLTRVPIHAGFLVSFMVDARGGAMRGCRHSGVRVIIPPRKASMPMRITCRYLRKEKLIHPPPLMEGEACASRILEMGPVGARFLGPVIIEVPHFASTRGKEREITILRSDTGENWREHTLEASEEAVQEVLNESFEGEELSALEDLNTNRITRILTTDFPQYFAIVTRVRQEVHGVGPESGMVSSTVVPQVQAIFPEGALTKKIRVGLQAQPIAPELVAKLLGNRVAVSPIVTVEPRRRKFHKPITLTIPVPQAATKGMINQYSGDAPTLRLLCSITGGSSKAQWEDVTGSTPLTFVNDCVSFTTTVSARFWLMDCRQVPEVTRYATELYQEAVYVPFMSKFVIFAKRHDPYEAQLRVFCMTDDKEDKTLESQEHFTEVAKSRDVEVLEGKLQYLEFAGNLVPVTKSGEQLKLTFQAFHENRLPFTVRVKDPHIEPVGRIAFMKEPKTARGEPPQVPICNLNVVLPDITPSELNAEALEMVTLEKRYDYIQEAGLSKPELIHRADLRLSDIARELDKDWLKLAQQLDVTESDIEQIKAETTYDQSEQALMMLRLWLQKSGSKATGNELEKGLRKINREDIIKNCMFNVELVTDDVEKAVAKVHLDQSGFDVFKEELGSSREASMRRGASLDISYDEQDIMKEAESAAETSSETGSLFERDQLSQALTDDKDACQTDVVGTQSSMNDTAISADKIAYISSSAEQCKSSGPSSLQVNKLNMQSDPVDTNDNINMSLETQPVQTFENKINNTIYNKELESAVNGSDNYILKIEQSSKKLHDFWPPDKVPETYHSIVYSMQESSDIKSLPFVLDESVSNNSFNKEQSLELQQNKKNEIMDPNINLSNIIGDDIKNSNAYLNANMNVSEYDKPIAKEISTNGKPLINPSEKDALDNEKASEINDLGYCSLDKDINDSSNLMTDNIRHENSLPSEIVSDKLGQKQATSCDSFGKEVLFENTDLHPYSILHSEQTINATYDTVLENTYEKSERNSSLKELQEHEEMPSNMPTVCHSIPESTAVNLVPTEVNILQSDESIVVTENSSQSLDYADKSTENSSAEDAKIRRPSKTPPPSPADEIDKVYGDIEKVKDVPAAATVTTEIKDAHVRLCGEVEIRPMEGAGDAGGQELLARLTESETWPSGDLDTSQVSVSSLPDDEKSEPTTATVSSATAVDDRSTAVSETVEKTQDDGCGITTHIIQKTTHMTISVQEKPEEGGLQGAASVSSEQEEMGSPKSPELSFAEKRDFFQKLSLSSSSPSTTPTHSLKTNATTEMKTEVYISEDNIAIADSSEEQLSFMERLKFFEKSDEQVVKPEVKEIKKEVWTVVTEDSDKGGQKTDDVFESPEKEREVEIVEIHENIVKSISKDEKCVSLPLYENKEVLETNKDTKVEVTVKRFVPGTEMIEICSVENIPADQDILKENFKAQQLVSLSSTVHQSAKEELHYASEVGKAMLESKADVDDSLKSKPESVPPSETCRDEIDLLESKNVEDVYEKKSVIETYETISGTSSEVSSKAASKSAVSDSDKIHQTGLAPSDLSKSVIEPGDSIISDAKEVSDEEFITRTYKTILEVSAEVPKATVDAFKKEDKTDKWQRESPDSIKIVKETMEPSLGKSEIFICTEETLDSVKRILSVADAESNIVMSESASTSTVLSDDQQKSVLIEREEREEIITKTVAHEPEELTATHLVIDQTEQDIHSKPVVTQKEILPEYAEQMASEMEKKTEVELKRDNSDIHSDGTISDIVHKQFESEISREQGKEAEFGKITRFESQIDSSEIKILDPKEVSEVTTKESDLTFEGKDMGTEETDIEKLKSKIENEREIGLHFDESLTRSLGSNEEKSDSCFSSVRDRSIEIEFLPVLEVSGDISKESVDKTGHEALGTPCSFHKQMSVDSRQSDLDQSLEEHEEKPFYDYEIEKKADVSPVVGAVEKAEYEEVEKKKQEDIESIIYRESISREKGGKETFHSVEVTQFKEHSTEVYSVPTEKLIEKFPSKKMHFEPLTEDKEPKFLPHKLDQFLDSVTQIDEYGAGISLPSDVAPIHKRTEEWIDQSGELLLKEGAMLDTADNGLFEDRPPTLEDEQHKRSSPTAESFDDKARVEQCDTDVMMQLLDFVSRNDIELAEVRTEDEAPDIEEDVSPSAEEEICTKVSGEESKVDDKLHSKELPASEEKTQECLKVVEAENLLLSPHRSSFDSVTSPSRKDIPSENIDTVVELTGQVECIHHIRQIMPQSSLEVEIGSRGSDELQLHDIEREVTPLSFVEEEEYIKHSTEVPHDVSKPVSESLKDQEFDDKKQLGSLITEDGKLDTDQNLVSETKQEGKKEDSLVHSVDKSVSEEREQETVDQFQTGENVLCESFEKSIAPLEKAAIISVVSGDTTQKEIIEQSVKTTGEKSKPVVSSTDDIVSTSPDYALESTEIPFAADESELPMDRPLLSTKTDMKLGEEYVQDRNVEITLEQDEFMHELKTTDLKHEQYIQPIQEFESELIPCAFVNTAFAGAELIDEVEQSASIRARSPYEVIREEQSSKFDQREELSLPEETEDLQNNSKISFISRNTDIHRRPILQHIPSEISEEDLVEREITSPTRQEFEVFGEDEIKLSEIAFNEAAFQSSQDLIKDGFSEKVDTMRSKKETTTVVNGNISENVEEICSFPQITRITTTTVKKTVIKTVSELDASGSGMNGEDAVARKLPLHEIELKSETSEYIAKTDDATTPESDTGIPTSPFEVLSESELSDGEHRSAHISMSATVPKSSTEKSHDSVIMTTHSQSFTDKTISTGISKDFSDSETLNEKSQCEELQLQSEGEAVLPAKLSSGIQHASDEHEELDATRVLNGPGEVDYHKEYDYDSEFPQTVSYEDKCIFDDMSCTEPRAHEIREPEDVKKSRYSSISDDGVDMEINEILKSEQQLEDIIERPVTPEPPKEELSNACTEKLGFDLSLPCAAHEDDYAVSDDGDQIVSSPGFSPDDSKTRFAYGIEFEKEILDVPEEAMDIDSDQYSEEKESSYAYAMRFERDPELDEEDIPCYGDLYTHEEEDEDALENGDKIKVVSKSDKDPEFDILAGRKYFSKNVELDDLSMSSLQEFERLEAEIVSGRKSSIGSLDSLNGKPPVSKSGEHDDVSMSSLTEFERLERECTESEKIDPAMQESITQLSEIEEGHESQASETSQENKSDVGKEEDLSIVEDYSNQLESIEEIMLEAKDQLPFQYLIKKTQIIDKPYEGKAEEQTTEDESLSTDVQSPDTKIKDRIHSSTVEMHTIYKTSETAYLVSSSETQDNDFNKNVRDDDLDQDSLHDDQDSLQQMLSLKPDSLTEDIKHEFQDSLREEKFDDADSLQGEIPDEMRDSLLEERHIEDDSLRDMDILPDESSLSLESSIAAVISHDSSKTDDHVKVKDQNREVHEVTKRSSLGSTLESFLATEKAEVIVSHLPKGDLMLSSTDSLEQSSSAAAFHLETDTAMSSSLNSAVTSEVYTMISSTDTLEQEGRITFRYEDIPVDELEVIIRDGRQVIVDSEGNIQAQYDAKHYIGAEDNVNNTLSFSSKDLSTVEHPSTSTVQVHSAVTTVSYIGEPQKFQSHEMFHSAADQRTNDSEYESSHFDPDVEVEEIHTTDEFGNPKVIKKIRRVIQTKTQYSSSSSSQNVEEKLKEFLKEHSAGESAGCGEEEIKEERTVDDKGNVVLIRTVQQQMLSEPQVHSRTFRGPDADAHSREFIETFQQLDPTENVCEYEKIDEQGNVVRVTQQVVVKPEMHTVSFSGPDAHKQMEEYMKQWTAMSQSREEYDASRLPHLFQSTHVSSSREELQEYIPSEGLGSDVTDARTITKTILSSLPSESSEQMVVHTTTTTRTSVSSFGTEDEPPSDSKDQMKQSKQE